MIRYTGDKVASDNDEGCLPISDAGLGRLGRRIRGGDLGSCGFLSISDCVMRRNGCAVVLVQWEGLGI